MSEKRFLTQGEIDLLTKIYGERDYFYQTTIERGNLYMRSAFGLVSNNNIKVGKLAYSDDFSQTAPEWFIHEGAHLVQEQTFGRHLAWSKAGEKFKSLFSNNYQYLDEVKKGIPFDEMAIEAQASMISDYYRAVQGKPGRYATLPVEVFQSIIPESYVPSFGRLRSADSTWQNIENGSTNARQRKDKIADALQGNRGRQNQRVPAPKPKPDRKKQSEFPLSNRPLIPGAQDILAPSFAPYPKELEKSAPAKWTLHKSSLDQDRSSNQSSFSGVANPFSIRSSNLKRQAEMLERDPGRARQMIVLAGRDPEMFGFRKAA
jgi:hypothetical protein